MGELISDHFGVRRTAFVHQKNSFVSPNMRDKQMPRLHGIQKSGLSPRPNFTYMSKLANSHEIMLGYPDERSCRGVRMEDFINTEKQDDLIYDIGMHKGEDTDFYLKKGFRVVAIEAHEGFCNECRQRFQSELDSGQLIIINKAISDAPGTVSFFVNESVSVWGTTNIDWVERNKAIGAKSHEVIVEATTINEILQQYNTPYYMKIDIEGSDILCLSGLINSKEKPKYISVEASATSIKETFTQLKILEQLGYTKFKTVPQHNIQNQRCPNPAREGVFVDYQIEPGSSGLFGEETPGEWRSIQRVKLEYLRYYIECRIIGLHNGVFRNISSQKIKKLLQNMFKRGSGGWYDTHATF